MTKEYEIHECDYLPELGIMIIKAPEYSFRKDKIWALVIQREATEDDLENNHHLENEGDLIWETILEISHCPYCGEKLTDLNINNTNDFGKFKFIDMSTWNKNDLLY